MQANDVRICAVKQPSSQRPQLWGSTIGYPRGWNSWSLPKQFQMSVASRDSPRCAISEPMLGLATRLALRDTFMAQAGGCVYTLLKPVRPLSPLLSQASEI